MNRRTLLRTSALLPIAALAACATTTTNGVTTITLNVAEVAAWGQAIVNSATLIAALPGIIGTPVSAVIAGVAPVAAADLAAFNKAAAGQLTLTFNSGSVPAAVQSLLADGQTILSDITNANAGVSATVLANAQTYITALTTIVSLLQAAIGTAPAAVGATRMSEASALANLGVK